MTGAARDFYLAGRFAEAEALLKAALADDPGNPDILAALGQVWFDMGRAELAGPAYLKAVRLQPTNRNVSRLAYCLEAVGQRDKARSVMGNVGQTYIIEIAGSCNLQCPSCPNGNSREALPGRQPMRKLMELERFRAIIGRISQRPWHGGSVILYNWGEPLLHPQIGDMVRIAQAAGIPASISTNLNAVKHLEAAIRARPFHFKVSMSGLAQETYGIGHAGGDAGDVVANLRHLRTLIDAHAPGMAVEVSFHLYRHNLHEVPAIRALTAELGFGLTLAIAYFAPHERILEMIATGGARPEDRDILDRLVLGVDQLLAHGRMHGARMRVCTTQMNQTIINPDGSVGLCCSVFDAAHNLAPDFLALPAAEVQRLKAESPFCARCVAEGLHVSFGGSYTDYIAADRRRLGNEALAALGSDIRL